MKVHLKQSATASLRHAATSKPATCPLINFPPMERTQFLFLRTLVPVAEAAGFPAGTFFVALASLIPLIVPITVLFAGSFFAAAVGFRTTVPLLESLWSLIVLALPLPTLGALGAAAARFPRPAPVAGLAASAFRAPAPARVDFAFSTMLVRMPAAPPAGVGAVGLRGEMGRARFDLAAGARPGERGSWRELAERGERTWVCSLDVVRAGGTGAPRVRFFGFSMSSFSLSLSPEEISSLERSAGGKNIARVYIPVALPSFLR